ncbi:MAG TPA: M1 family metallopeptidase [Actinomycetota bacterium]
MGIRRARAAVAAAVLVAMTLLGTALAPAGASTGSAGGGGGGFRPGAPGVGDPYFPNYGNGGYDVRHYLLKVAYDPPTDRLTGVATISATATQNLSRFNLDFVGLTVRSIKVNGRAASWSRTAHELMVTPRHGLPKGHRFTTVVRYDGVPITQQLVLGPGFTIEAGFIHTDDGAIVAGQPEVAASWFPVNDHPIDKASYTFVVTAPAGLQVVANGRLLGRKRHGAKRTWVWNAPEPMASYLATVNIGQFDIHRYRTHDGLWMYDALDPDLFDEAVDPGDPASPTFGGIARDSFARQGEILDFLEQRFSRYPFSTGGGIVDDYDNLQFALETQTRPIYSKFFFTTPANGDSVVVHELAHQWFGDSVALAEWKHIWLNEGFAQYAEWMWSEEEGLGTAQEQFDALYNGIPADDPFWQVVIGDPGPELLFDIAVYFRGAMAVHALRLEVGDRDFFRILHAWTTRRAGGNGTIPQFIRLAERVSGEQLDDLFQAWLFTGSKPALEAAAAARASASPPAPSMELMRR